jgi:hypothetical protein
LFKCSSLVFISRVDSHGQVNPNTINIDIAASRLSA